MTCIVGLVDKKSVWIGGDSAGSNGYQIRIRKDTKVFQIGDFLIGYTTSFRMGQLLRFSTPPKHDDKSEPYHFMVNTFVPWLRDLFRSGGFLTIENNVERGGFFLVGFANRLFAIEADFQVAEQSIGFHAVGSGDDVALGSLWSTKGMEPRKRLLTALKASTEFCSGVRPPFKILKLKEAQ